MQTVSMTVNGKAVTCEIENRTLLVDFLRENLALTGTHVGCDTSQCGTCTIHVNNFSVKSCTMLAVQANGAEVLTIEGVADGSNLHPIQAAFLENAALQCGICTPGFIIASKALLEKNPDPTEHEIRFWLANNLCRCTGYDKIVRAVQDAAKRMQEA